MARLETTSPWRVLGLAVLAQFGVSVVDQGLPTLNGYVKAELGASGGITIGTVLPLASSPVERSYELEAHHEHGVESPARDRNIRLLTLWGCLVVTGQYAIVAFLALDLHRSAGLSLARASLLVSL